MHPRRTRFRAWRTCAKRSGRRSGTPRRTASPPAVTTVVREQAGRPVGISRARNAILRSTLQNWKIRRTSSSVSGSTTRCRWTSSPLGRLREPPPLPITTRSWELAPRRMMRRSSASTSRSQAVFTPTAPARPTRTLFCGLRRLTTLFPTKPSARSMTLSGNALRTRRGFNTSRIFDGIRGESNFAGWLCFVFSTARPQASRRSTTLDLEQLTGCTREELGSALWYLREKEARQRPGNSPEYSITAAGFDVVENNAADRGSSRIKGLA